MKLILAILLGALVGTGGYAFWSAEAVSYLSDDPKVCANCHIMNEQFDGWQKASHQAVATCNDCHTPHAFIPKYLYKAESGFKHAYGFTLQNFHEPIHIKPRGAAVLNKNCVACHSDLVSKLIVTHGDEKSRINCTHCHADVGH